MDGDGRRRFHGIRHVMIESIDIVLDGRGVREEDGRKDSVKGTKIERVTGSCTHVR
jgi:hypothetical protein